MENMSSASLSSGESMQVSKQHVVLGNLVPAKNLENNTKP